MRGSTQGQVMTLIKPIDIDGENRQICLFLYISVGQVKDGRDSLCRPCLLQNKLIRTASWIFYLITEP